MNLKIVNEIDNNVFSCTITVDSFGTEQMSATDEQDLLADFPTTVAYRTMKFEENIKVEGNVPVKSDIEPDESTTVKVTLPPVSNKEIALDENFEAVYRTDLNKIAQSATDEHVLTTRELVAQAYCVVFADIVVDAVKKIMEELRKKAPGFESESYVNV